MRKLLYALAAVAALAPLAAFGTASATPAHPAAPAAHAAAPAARVRPFNLDPNKCWKITDPGGSSGYGSLYWNGSKIVSSHSHYTAWCPATFGGWQAFEDGLGNDAFMADHASGNYLTEYTSSTCDIPNSPHTYCEWAEFFNSSTSLWTIQSAYNSDYITAVGSGVPVELAPSGSTHQHWTITCVASC